MTELLHTPFFLRALLAALLIGFVNGFVSGFVLLRRNALALSALGHAILPGIVIVILITGQFNQMSAFGGGLIASLLVGIAPLIATRHTRLPQSSALTVFFTTAFALGIVLLNYTTIPQNLENILLGNILSVSSEDLKLFFILGSITLLSATLFMRPLLLTLFEPHVASVQGVHTKNMEILLYLLVIIALTTSVQAVGTILSIGLLVTPASIIALFTHKTQWLFWGSALLGSLLAFSSVLLSVPLDLPTGPCIVCVLGISFIVSLLTKRIFFAYFSKK